MMVTSQRPRSLSSHARQAPGAQEETGMWQDGGCAWPHSTSALLTPGSATRPSSCHSPGTGPRLPRWPSTDRTGTGRQLSQRPSQFSECGLAVPAHDSVHGLDSTPTVHHTPPVPLPAAGPIPCSGRAPRSSGLIEHGTAPEDQLWRRLGGPTKGWAQPHGTDQMLAIHARCRFSVAMVSRSHGWESQPPSLWHQPPAHTATVHSSLEVLLPQGGVLPPGSRCWPCGVRHRDCPQGLSSH